MSPSNILPIEDNDSKLSAAKRYLGVNVSKGKSAYSPFGNDFASNYVLNKWAGMDSHAEPGEKKIFEDFWRHYNQQKRFMNSSRNVSAGKALNTSNKYLFPMERFIGPARMTELYPGYTPRRHASVVPTNGGIQQEFGFMGELRGKYGQTLGATRMSDLPENIADKIKQDREIAKRAFEDRVARNTSLVKGITQKTTSVVPWGVSERISQEDMPSAMASVLEKQTPIRRVSRISERSLGDTLSGAERETSKVTQSAYEHYRRAEIAEVIKNQFSPSDAIWFKSKPKKVTVDDILSIKKSLHSKGIVSNEDSSLFGGLTSLKSWQLRQRYFEIKAKLFGGTFYGDRSGSKFGKYVEGSIFEFKEGHLPIERETLELGIVDRLRSAGELMDERSVTASEIAEKAGIRDEFSRNINDFEIRKKESEAFDDLSKSFVGNSNKSKSLDQLFKSRKRTYTNWLKNLSYEKRHAFELDYLSRDAVSKPTAEFSMGVSALESRAINAMIAENPGMTSSEINEALSKMKTFERGALLNPVLSPEEYLPWGYEYSIGKVSASRDIHKGMLRAAGVSPSDIKKSISKTAELMAIEDVAYGTVRSQKGLADAVKIARRQFGSNVGGAITQEELNSLDEFLRNNPQFSVRSTRGGTYGFLDPDLLMARQEKIQRTASLYGVNLSESEIEAIAPKSDVLTKELSKELEIMKNNRIGDGVRNFKTYQGPGISPELSRINERLKLQGRQGKIQRELLAFDIETTGFGHGAQLGGARDYITQIGWSKTGRGAEQFLVNQFEGGIPGEALKSRYYGIGGAFGTTKIGLEDVALKGVVPREAARRFLDIAKPWSPEAPVLLSYGAESFDIPKFMRGLLPRESFGLKSLDVLEMARAVLPSENLKLFSQFGFEKPYALGNVAMNLGIIPQTNPINLHGAAVDASITRRVYERLLPMVEDQVSMGNTSLTSFLPENALKHQRRSYISGQRYMDQLSKVGIEYGMGGGTFGVSATNFVVPISGAKRFPELERFLTEGMQTSESGIKPFVREQGLNYVIPRESMDPRLSPETSFATQFERIGGSDRFNPFGVRRDVFISGMDDSITAFESVKKSVTSNWRGIALAGAAVAVGAYVLNSWKSRPKPPIEREPGDQSDSLLFGSSGRNVLNPPDMDFSISPVNPMSYSARIMDPSSVATNIRIKGKSRENIDYMALGKAMGITGSSITRSNNSRVNVNMRDDSSKMSDYSIKRRIARMA